MDDNKETVEFGGLDFSFFTTEDALIVDKQSQKETKRKRKNSNNPKMVIETDVDADNIVLVNPIQGSSVAEVDYGKSYNETNNLLRNSINQLDDLNQTIRSDIEDVRNSKTIKNKYTYLTNLTASASSILSTKIAAIREMNSTITQTHNLELNRMKALKLDKDDTNDDMKMMDIYNAFVNTPIGSYAPASPSIQDITANVANSNTLAPIEMVSSNTDTYTNLTPEQNRMRMESNPNIQVVVRYNQMNGQRFFDVIDTTNGMSVPNYPRPDSFLLEDTVIDVNSKIARNRNINSVWPLIIEGNVTEY